MTKGLKRLISLLSLAAFLMTSAPAVLADGEEDASADTAVLTLEDVVGHQPSDMITENLTLPDGYEWKTDVDGVIDVSTGAVTRSPITDKTVVLTATKDGVSQAFTLTVKSKMTTVYAAETFAYDYDDTADALLKDGFIFSHYGDGNPNTVHVVKGSDGNSYLYDSMKADTMTTTLAENKIYNSRVYWSVGSAKDALNSEDVVYIEFDMNYTNGTNPYFAFNAVYSDNDADGLIGTNSSATFRVGGIWGTTVDTFTYGAWTHVAVKLDMNSKLVSAKIGDSEWKQYGTALANFTDDVTVSGFMIVPLMGDDCGTLLVDDFVIYSEATDSLADEEAADKLEAVYNAITADAIITDDDVVYSVANNLNLDAPFAEMDLEEMGVSVNWTSSDTSVISNNGTVSRQSGNRTVVITAEVSMGSGDSRIAVTKDITLTVAAEDSSVFTTYNYNFEDAQVGEAADGWTENSASTSAAAVHPDKKGTVLCAEFTGEGYTRTTNVNGGELDKLYYISADVCFEPDSTDTKSYLRVWGADKIISVGFNFKNSTVTVIGDDAEREYRLPNVTVQTGEWYHIDVTFNAAKKNFTAYVNGEPVTNEPLDIAKELWTAYCPIRSIGIYQNASGTGYIDNVIIRESNSKAPVYDENSDYTVRSIALLNSNGKAITNPSSTATSVTAKVKLIENRTPEDGEVKILFARYGADGKLAQIVSQTVETQNKGLIANVTMPLEGDCSDDVFKAFVSNSTSFKPLCVSFNNNAQKFDTEYLFDKATNKEDAYELGYNAESDYSGIDAIIYDGDTYLGKKARHFAYVGLPEGASAENPVPAVVCVHGGGGTAYDTWVKKWNDAGYAAIAMDLNGRIPTDDGNFRHKWAGATSDNYVTASPDDAAWMYSAVTAVIGAHNVLREMPEVDNSKIGINGVSWGGVVTSTTIGVDDRFAFAIPSYGCGYLYGSETYMATLMTEEKKLWEPSEFIADAELPILWMNGDGDGNFSLTSTTKSALLAGDNSYVAIIPGFGHSHEDTWNRTEPYAFADSIVNGGTEFIRGTATVADLTATVKTNRAAKSATLYYTTSDTLAYDSSGREPQFSFSAVSSSLTDTDTFTFELPSDAKKFYVVFKDENSNSTSTVLYNLD